MRTTNVGDDGTTGLSASLKGIAIVLAVGILALVAGRTAYTNNDGAVALPASMMPARDDAPVAGQFNSANSGMGILDQRIMAASPAGISATEIQVQEAAKPTASPAQQEEPVATF